MTEAAPDAAIRPGPVAVLAPAESPPSVPFGPRVCLDCGALLNGKFCSVCGQKDEPLKRGLRELALEFFQHPLIDTKLWRSLRPLLLRPGALTVEYLAGRRTRYVRPLKLYLTVSVVFFALLAMSVSPDKWVKFDVQPDKAVGQGVSQSKNSPHIPIHWLDERWQRNTAALEGPESKATQLAMASRVAGSIPKMVFLLLPLSAVLFKLFWWRRYFVEHLVFTLHLHSYVFAAGLLRFLHWTPVTFLILGWSCGYMALAFKRVYGEGWPKTVAKLLGVALSYTVLLAAALILTAVVALLTA